MNNSFIALFLTCFVAFSSCNLCKKKGQGNMPEIQVKGTAQRYHAALGAGDGVLFLVHLSSSTPLNREKIQADSLLVNGNSLPAALRADSNLVIEGNYFVPKPERTPEKPELPSLNPPDPILYLEQYYPATLYIHYMNKAYALPITEFQSISE